MRFLKTIVIAGLAVLSVRADYEVKLTFNNGAERTVSGLVVQAGKVVLGREKLSVPFAQIKSAVFTFDEPLNVDECEGYFRRGEYKPLVDRLDAFLAPVKQGLALQNNLDVYVQQKMRACFWAEQYDTAQAAAEVLQSKNSNYASLAGLYQILILLEQGGSEADVLAAFSKIESPAKVSGAITEYLRGRLALLNRDYENALEHFSKVVVYPSRDPEWAPAAAYYEAVVYKRTGYLESAANIAKEFEIAYPGSYWGTRANELK